MIFRLFLLLLVTSAACAEPIYRENIVVNDGDTIEVVTKEPGVPNIRYRLNGFDTPESGSSRRFVSADEFAVAKLATERLIELIESGPIDLEEVRCSCSEGTHGTKSCNHGRKCGILRVDGKDVGETLIAEELAVPYVCSETKCPRMPNWQKILDSRHKR